MRKHNLFFRVLRQAAALAAVLIVAPPGQDAFAEDDREYAMRAAMIINFVRFTRWPDRAFERSAERITICTSGQSILYTELKRTEGTRIRGKAISVQNSLYFAIDQRICHIMVLTEETGGGGRQFQAENTLIISTVEGTEAESVSIELVNIGRQIRFIVNPAAAKASGVEISSKLIDLAVRVR